MATGTERIVCPSCGANNFPQSAVCWKCGEPVPRRAPNSVVPARTPRTASPQATASVPPHPGPQSGPAVCTVCTLSILPGEEICPRCGVPLQPSRYPNMLVIHLDHLYKDPLAKLMWDTRDKKATETQIAKFLKDQGYPIEAHALYAAIIDTQGNSAYVNCNHLNHDTPEKRLACKRKEAAKLALRTIRHHFGFLERLQMWEEGGVSHAMWGCIERHHPACGLCRNREGMIVSTSMRFVTILHPGCNCTLEPLDISAEQRIKKVLAYLGKMYPERASIVERNLIRCGVRGLGGSRSSGLGCGVFALLALMIVSLLILLAR